MYRSEVFGHTIPDNVPTFGGTVLFRAKHQDTKRPFDPKGREGIFLCWNSVTTQGIYVAIWEPDRELMNVISFSGPLP